MQDWLAGVLAVVTLAAGAAYMTMGLRARRHLNESASRHDRSIGWLFWWSFDIDRYDDEGRRLCRRARGLAFVVIALYGVWCWVLLRGA